MRRPRVRYSELTSLLDVLFIVVFAALVQASGLVQQARQTPAKPQPTTPARPTVSAPDGGVAPDAVVASKATAREDTQSLRRRAAAAVVAASARSGVVLRVQVSAAGRITNLTVETGGQMRSVSVDLPLLERVPDPNVGVAYLGHKSAAQRVCTAVRRALAWRSLRDALVIVQPALPLSRLQVALVEGLRADQNRCYPEERGLAVIVDPEIFQKRKTTP